MVGRSPCTLTTTSWRPSGSNASTASKMRSEPDGWSSRVMTAMPPARSIASTMARSSVATTTGPSPASMARRQTCTIIGSPRMSASGLSGQPCRGHAGRDEDDGVGHRRDLKPEVGSANPAAWAAESIKRERAYTSCQRRGKAGNHPPPGSESFRESAGVRLFAQSRADGDFGEDRIGQARRVWFGEADVRDGFLRVQQDRGRRARDPSVRDGPRHPGRDASFRRRQPPRRRLRAARSRERCRCAAGPAPEPSSASGAARQGRRQPRARRGEGLHACHASKRAARTRSVPISGMS